MAGRLLRLLRAFTTSDMASQYPLRHWFPSSCPRNQPPPEGPENSHNFAANENSIYE